MMLRNTLRQLGSDGIIRLSARLIELRDLRGDFQIFATSPCCGPRKVSSMGFVLYLIFFDFSHPQRCHQSLNILLKNVETVLILVFL
jgi:hypothetical protein